jgi:hypothetical protein
MPTALSRMHLGQMGRSQEEHRTRVIRSGWLTHPWAFGGATWLIASSVSVPSRCGVYVLAWFYASGE